MDDFEIFFLWLAKKFVGDDKLVDDEAAVVPGPEKFLREDRQELAIPLTLKVELVRVVNKNSVRLLFIASRV